MFISCWCHVVPPMFDPAKILRLLIGGLADENMSGRAHSVLCEMFLFISTFVHVVPPLFDPAHYWGSRGHLQQGVPGRYLIMEGYTLYVPVLRCWYLGRLTKMLWATALIDNE